MNLVDKLENPNRVNELSPRSTLQKTGLKENDVFCDIGAGTGLFTFAATEITSGAVYAVDTSEAMREILKSRSQGRSVIVEDSIAKVPESACDAALMCTVLHEIPDKQAMLREIRRILKSGGSLTVIDFHESPTIMGPPLHMRISEKKAIGLLAENGFVQSKSFSLGENLYCVVFHKNEA